MWTFESNLKKSFIHFSQSVKRGNALISLDFEASLCKDKCTWFGVESLMTQHEFSSKFGLKLSLEDAVSEEKNEFSGDESRSGHYCS
jgi:hypothetical protein